MSNKESKVENAQSAVYQYLAAASIALMLITSGMHYAWSSPSLEKLQLEDSPIKINNSEGYWLATMHLIGGILGSAACSVTIDFIGRKRAILSCGPLYFSMWIMIAFANSLELLYIARFVVGIVDGLLFAAAIMYTAEISDPKIRGFIVSSVPITWNCGILIINVVGSYLSISKTAFVSSVLPVISTVTFFWFPESPYALVMKGNQEEAKRSLTFFRGLKDVETELSRISSAIKEQMTDTGKILDLIKVKSNRKAVLIITVLRGVQLFSGSATIILYTQTIFREAGGNISPEVASIIYVALQLIICMFSSSIVDRAGRRPLLIISTCGSAIALFVEGTYFFLLGYTDIEMENYSYVSLIALIAYVIIFSVGMQVIPFLMLGELFPANVKAFAICSADIYYSVVVIIASKFFQLMKDNYGMYVPFYAFSAVCIIGVIFVITTVPETKGKTLEEIQLHLKGETKTEKKNKIDC